MGRFGDSRASTTPDGVDVPVSTNSIATAKSPSVIETGAGNEKLCVTEAPGGPGR